MRGWCDASGTIETVCLFGRRLVSKAEPIASSQARINFQATETSWRQAYLKSTKELWFTYTPTPQVDGKGGLGRTSSPEKENCGEDDKIAKAGR